MLGFAGQGHAHAAVGFDTQQPGFAAGGGPEVPAAVAEQIPDVGLFRPAKKLRPALAIDAVDAAVGGGGDIECAAAVVGQGIDLGFFGLKEERRVARGVDPENLAPVAGGEVEVAGGIAGDIPDVGFTGIDEAGGPRREGQPAVAGEGEVFQLAGDKIGKGAVGAKAGSRRSRPKGGHGGQEQHQPADMTDCSSFFHLYSRNS